MQLCYCWAEGVAWWNVSFSFCFLLLKAEGVLLLVILVPDKRIYLSCFVSVILVILPFFGHPVESCGGIGAYGEEGSCVFIRSSNRVY